MAENDKKVKRPAISKTIQQKLWINTAGFCGFEGCDQFLFTESLTLSESNYSDIAHIVAASPKGPRGNEHSTELTKEYSNLLLMCQVHHREIDKFPQKYTIEILRTWKENHEDKVKLLIGQYGNERTDHLILLSKINNQTPSISLDKVIDAIFPRYPRNRKGITIDLTNFDPDNDGSLDALTKRISNKVKQSLEDGLAEDRPTHLSVFGLATIPLLVYLGKCLGNKTPSDLFQQQRSTQSWKWQEEPVESNFSYKLIENEAPNSKKIAFILSLSGKIDHSEINPLIGDGFSIYEITVDGPNRDFLISKERLNKFRRFYIELLSKIRQIHGQDCEIHIFPAIPAPIAIAIGQEILPKSDPDIYIYDNNKQQGGFKKILKIN